MLHCGECKVTDSAFSGEDVVNVRLPSLPSKVPLHYMENVFGPAKYGLYEMASIESPKLLGFLRLIESDIERREVTRIVHQVKMTDWRKHKNFNNSLAGFLVDGIHEPFREDFHDIVERSTAATINVDLFTHLNSSLHHHHCYENSSIFPDLRRSDKRVAEELDIMEKDYAGLVALERKIVTGDDRLALLEFIASLNDHLNRNEILIIPLLMRDEHS